MATSPCIIGIDLLNYAPYGAYAVNLDQTIWYWNPAAERITGHKAWNLMSRPCFQVIQNLTEHEDTPVCQSECPSLRATREGRVPLVYDVRMLYASGQRKRVLLTPLVIGAPEVSSTVLAHLFHDSKEHARAAGAVETLMAKGTSRKTPEPPEVTRKVTPRELEVLRMTAIGMTPAEIAEILHISYHTVRNHTTNLRRKLGAKNKFTLVRNAQESGIL